MPEVWAIAGEGDVIDARDAYRLVSGWSITTTGKG
jgi:hypothetical protein